MSILEYAQDVNHDVLEIIELCKSLNIKKGPIDKTLYFPLRELIFD